MPCCVNSWLARSRSLCSRLVCSGALHRLGDMGPLALTLGERRLAGGDPYCIFVAGNGRLQSCAQIDRSCARLAFVNGQATTTSCHHRIIFMHAFT